MAITYLEKWDKRISWALMWSFVANALNYVIKSVIPISGSLWTLISILVAVSILAAYGLCFEEVMRRVSRPFVITVAIFAFIYSISILLCLIRQEPIDLVAETARSTYLFYIPAGILAIAVNDKKILYETMLKASFILSFLMIFRMFVNYNPLYIEEEEIEYSMSFGYILIVPTLLHFHEFVRSRKLFYLLFFIIELVCLFVYASRGVLLSVFALIIYECLFGIKHPLLKATIILLMIGVLIGYIQFGQELLNRSIAYLDSYGVQSRTLAKIAEGSLDSSSGRDRLFEISYKMIQERPLLGWGVGGECYHFNGFLMNEKANVACTSHNGVLQAMVQLGIPLGLLLSLLIVIPIFGAHRIKDEYLKNIVVVYFFAYAIPCLTISSGFLVQPQIAIYLFLYFFAFDVPRHLTSPHI